uniref:One-helix protein 2 n=2 Tax=Silene latifolia TaxID=37657 RepID=T1DBT9_SILLA
MSVATSVPCMRMPTTSSSSCSCSSYSLRLSQSKPCISFTTIRSSQTEGPIRRPVASPSTPSLKPPLPPSTPSSTSPAPPKPAAVVEDKNVVTLEFQRAKARELQEYFKQKKLELASQGPVFGWVPKNEIGNGRWAMFGFAVGMLTEYATGSDFVDQLKLILSNLGIVDLD